MSNLKDYIKNNTMGVSTPPTSVEETNQHKLEKHENGRYIVQNKLGERSYVEHDAYYAHIDKMCRRGIILGMHNFYSAAPADKIWNYDETTRNWDLIDIPEGMMKVPDKIGDDSLIPVAMYEEISKSNQENNDGELESSVMVGIANAERELDAKLEDAKAKYEQAKLKQAMTESHAKVANKTSTPGISSRIANSEMARKAAADKPMDTYVEEEKEHVIEEVQEIKPNRQQRRAKKNIDLTKINVVSKTDRGVADITNNYIERIKNRRGTANAYLPMSGYSAKLRGMSSPELRNYQLDMANAATTFEQKTIQFEYLYAKMVDTSAGAITFSEFLKATSFLEYEIPLYALLCATYPDSNEFNGKCGHCKHSFKFNVNNSSYLHIDENNSDEYVAKVYDIMKGHLDATKEMFDNAPTKEVQRVLLEDIEAVVELRHPTLYDYLIDTVEKMEKAIDDNSSNKFSEDAVYKLVFIDRILIPNAKGEYVPVTDIVVKNQILEQISDEDDADLIEGIEQITDQYKISFFMDEQRCPKCSKIAVAKQSVSVESMLFLIQEQKKMLRG